MDFLWQSGRQWMAQWREAPPASRWMLGLVLAFACGVLALLMGWPRMEARELLFDGVEFSRSELTAMEVAFGKAQLNDARVVGRTLEVPRAKRHLYLKALLDQQALPATFYSYAQRSLASDHPFSSPRQREASAKLAKEQEVALMLRKISGIEEASVQYEDVDLGGFPRRKQRRATAAVRANAGSALEGARVDAIRVTLMNTLGIADADAVTVLDLNAGVAHTGDVPGAAPVGLVTGRVAAASGTALPGRVTAVAPPAADRAVSPASEAREANAASPRRSPGTILPKPDAGEGTAIRSRTRAGAVAGGTVRSPWLRDNGLTLAIGMLGVSVLWLLAGTLRRTRSAGRRARSLLRASPAAQEDTGTSPDSAPRRPAPLVPGVQQLREHVQSDVVSAAATLRQWLGNAA